MSTFGDFEPADAADTARPDPEALARFVLHEERRLSGDNGRREFDDLPELERILLLFAMASLIDKLEREWQR